MPPGPERRRFRYRVSFIIGPFDKAPALGNPILRMIGIFTRAGYPVTVRIEYVDGDEVVED